MSGRPTVRPVGPGEASALAGLHFRSFADAWSSETMEALLVRPYVKAFGALVNPDAALRGFVLIQVIADEAEVLTFCVEPEFRGRKLGATLLDAAAACAAALGVTRMFLEVNEGNAAARKLYEQQGFVVVGRRSAYYREAGQGNAGADALIMRKALPETPSSAK
jgi:ribosomal-protein-alanine N-acetyltransferase